MIKIILLLKQKTKQKKIFSSSHNVEFSGINFSLVRLRQIKFCCHHSLQIVLVRLCNEGKITFSNLNNVAQLYVGFQPLVTSDHGFISHPATIDPLRLPRKLRNCRVVIFCVWTYSLSFPSTSKQKSHHSKFVHLTFCHCSHYHSVAR